MALCIEQWERCRWVVILLELVHFIYILYISTESRHSHYILIPRGVIRLNCARWCTLVSNLHVISYIIYLILSLCCVYFDLQFYRLWVAVLVYVIIPVSPKDLHHFYPRVRDAALLRKQLADLFMWQNVWPTEHIQQAQSDMFENEEAPLKRITTSKGKVDRK